MDRFVFNVYRKDFDHIMMMGSSPDHVTPMDILNQFLGEECICLGGGGMMVHLVMNDKHADLWSEKIGKRKDLWDDETGDDHYKMCIRLDKMKQELEQSDNGNEQETQETNCDGT